MLTLIVVNSIGNEEESIGVSRLYSYLDTKIDHEVEMLYLYNYLNHAENLAKINKSSQYIGIDIYHDTANYVYQLATDLKKINQDVKIFTGSKFATMAYKEILADCPAIDYVVLGDGEYALEEAIKKLDAGESIEEIKNIVTRQDTTEKAPEFIDLNTLPGPSRDEHLLSRLYRAYLYTNSFCSSKCLFCSTNLSKKPHFRPVDCIFNEILFLSERYGIKSFFFVDDSFEEPIGPKGKERLSALCDKVLESGKKFSFTGQIKARSFGREDLPLLKKMKEAGFYQLYVGIESGSDHELTLYRKRATAEENHQILNLLDEAGFDTSFFGYILYGPYSTKEDLVQNIEFLIRHNTWNLLLYLSKLRVYYKTDLYHKILQDGLLKDTYTYKSLFEYNFQDQDVEMADKVIEQLYEFEFLDKMTSFFNYYMYYIAMREIYPVENPQVIASIETATANIAALNADFFRSIYSDNGPVAPAEYMRDVIANIDEAFKFKYKLRSEIERKRLKGITKGV